MRMHNRSMRRIGHTLLAASLLGVAVPGLGELKPGTPAPEFPAKSIWLGRASPMTLRQLRGKVVILDFWEYTCINSVSVPSPPETVAGAMTRSTGLEIIGVPIWSVCLRVGSEERRARL